MQPVFFYKCFRKFLTDAFDERTRRNDLYSLRAFARDLGLSHSRLSEFLNGKSPISSRLGRRVCEALLLEDAEKTYLIDLIKSEFHPSLKIRESSRLSASVRHQTHVVGDETKAPDLLEKWFYLPIIEFLTLSTPATTERIAGFLDLSLSEVDDAVRFLEENQAIKRCDDRWEKSHAFVKFISGQPSAYHKQFHETFLRRAVDALHSQAIPERRFISWIFTLDGSDLCELRAELDEFMARLVKKYTDKTKTNVVYSLGAQLFKLGESNAQV